MNNLIEQIIAFRDARNWAQFHNLKDLSLSLTIEAAELMELFQWKTVEEALEANKDKMAYELADVLMYALIMCHQIGLDPENIIKEKLKLNNQKYPIEKAYGSNKKYTEL